MNVLGHHHIPDQSEIVAVAHLRKDFQEQIACSRPAQQRLAAIATASNKVEMSLSIPALQPVLHSCLEHTLHHAQKMRHPLSWRFALCEIECAIIAPGAVRKKDIYAQVNWLKLVPQACPTRPDRVQCVQGRR